MEKTIIGLSKGRIAKAYIDRLYKNNIINTKPEESRKLYFETENYSFAFLKPNDIINCLINGIIDVGIIGSDIYYDVSNDKITWVDEVDLFNCNFALAAPKDTKIEDIKKIAVCSEYAAFQYYFEKNKQYLNKKSMIVTEEEINDWYQKYMNDFNYVLMDGSLELAPKLGYADAIVDIVETGETLKANNLEIKKIYNPIWTMIITTKRNESSEKVEEFVRVNKRIRQ